MSSHADTIRAALTNWSDNAIGSEEERKQHDDAWAAVDEWEAENQRLRETPRAIYVKVSTALLADLTEWSDPVRVKIERQADDTYEMTFKREALAGDAE